MKYLSIIEKYYWGDLNENEVESFNESLRNNPELRAEFERYGQLVRSLERFGNHNLSDHDDDLNNTELDQEIIKDIDKYSGKEPLSPEELDLLEKIKEVKSGKKQ